VAIEFFHQTWTANLAAALNSERLPPGFFALAEQITGGPEADVVALELTPPAGTSSLSGMAAAVAPPTARFVARSEAANYARKADRIAIRHPDGGYAKVELVITLRVMDRRHAWPSAGVGRLLSLMRMTACIRST